MRSRVESGRTSPRFLVRAFLRTFVRGRLCATFSTARVRDSGFFIGMPEYTLRLRDLESNNQERGMKQVFAVATGFILWSVLWLGLNQLLLLLGVMPPTSTQPLTDAKPLVMLLVGSVLISLLSGYVASRISGLQWALPAAALGLLLLATGVFVQLKLWYLIPLWYHLIFLVLLMPMTVLGARLRARSQERMQMRSRSVACTSSAAWRRSQP